MDYKNEQHRFVNTYFISALFCFVIVVFALLIYFILPSSTKEEISTSSEVISLEDDKDQFEEETISESFVEYLADVSFEKLNNDDDIGLILYRQTNVRPSVEWFYSHITGNRDVALAILSEAEKNDIPLSLAFSLAYTESRYKTNAVNKNSNSTIDRGLFQLNNNSFPELTESDFFDPFISAKYGMSHLRFCLNTAGNDVSALAMYNAGTSRVRSNKTPQVTLNYVGKIISYREMLDDLFEQEVVEFYESQLLPSATLVLANKSE